MINKAIILRIIFLWLLCTGMQPKYLFAQEEEKDLSGSVSFITGQSIYVKFLSTKGIEDGDTLFIKLNEKYIPALLVQNHSSISCLCHPIGENKFQVLDKIYSKVKTVKEIKASEPETLVEVDVNQEVLKSAENQSEKPKLNNALSGRINVSSYSNFSNSMRDDSHRFRYTFSLKASNISNSKLSAETYISFSHKINQWDIVQENLNNALKIYSLALKYDFNESTNIWLGRKINSKIANIGAVDGLQFQKQWGKLFAGAVIGTRPDYQDYGFNQHLLEYGAYVGQNSKVENGFIQSSLALLEQRNGGKTDRRFAYFQHSNSVIKNVNMFSSFELDLYKLENGLAQNTISLTSFYFSLQYRISRRFSVFGSYDNRKNVIYYETFRNYADEILQLASRQGFRMRFNYRPLNLLNLGVNAGTRFRKEDPRPTNTLNAYATYSRIPLINASFSLSSNLMQTSYLNGQVYGARLSKDIVPGKFFGTFNYRWVHFDYVNSGSSLNQIIGEIDFSYQFNKKLFLSVNFEGTFQKDENFNRVYINLRRKF